MSFLGMGTFEILIILLVAFIFLGPERMLDAARILGKWTGELRRMGSTVQAEMDDLANVNAPLSSRYDRPDHSRDRSPASAPLDQDHPSESSDPIASPDSDRSVPVSDRGAPGTKPQGQPPDAHSTQREESA